MKPMTYGEFVDVMDARVEKIAERIRAQCLDNQGPDSYMVEVPLDWGVPSMIRGIRLFRDVSRPSVFGVQLLVLRNSVIEYTPWMTFPVTAGNDVDSGQRTRKETANKQYTFLYSARFFFELVRALDTLEAQLLTGLTTEHVEWLSAVTMFRQVR